MSFPYSIKYGDTLTLIANRNGFSSWRDIYYHPENTGFRMRRPNPDKIYPGDVIMIPKDAPVGPPQSLPPTPPIPAEPLSTRFVLEQPGHADDIMREERDFFFRILDALNPNVPQLYWLGPPGGYQHVQGRVEFGRETFIRRRMFQVAAPGRAITDLGCAASYVTQYRRGHAGMLSRLFLQLPHSIEIETLRPYMPEAGRGPFRRQGPFQRVEHPERWIDNLPSPW